MFKFVTFFLLLLMSFGSHACSCQNDLKTHVNSSNKIFLGKAVSAILQSETASDSSYVKAKFSVTKVLKGEMQESATVKTRPPGGDCGVPITVGQTYIIFLREGIESIGMCGGSHELLGLEEEELPKEILAFVKKSKKNDF